MPSGFQMLLIASSRALSAVEGTGIMAVTMPLSVYELVNTLEMMLQSAARRRKKERAKPKVRSAEEQHIIDRAKSLLIERNHMTESEAIATCRNAAWTAAPIWLKRHRWC